MRRSQISFEFIVLFGLALFIFMLFVSVIYDWMEKARTTEDTAAILAKEVKLKVITASLAQMDFESVVDIPKRINGINIVVTIEGTENLLLIKEKDTGRLLAKSFLPFLNTAAVNGYTLKIKKEGETLSIE